MFAEFVRWSDYIWQISQDRNVLEIRQGFLCQVQKAHLSIEDQSEIPQSFQTAEMDRVPLLSKEDIIGKLPSIYPGDLDAATTGSCGIQLPWKLPEPLAQ